jgi:hypothetical protein
VSDACRTLEKIGPPAKAAVRLRRASARSATGSFDPEPSWPRPDRRRPGGLASSPGARDARDHKARAAAARRWLARSTGEVASARLEKVLGEASFSRLHWAACALARIAPPGLRGDRRHGEDAEEARRTRTMYDAEFSTPRYLRTWPPALAAGPPPSPPFPPDRPLPGSWRRRPVRLKAPARASRRSASMPGAGPSPIPAGRLSRRYLPSVPPLPVLPPDPHWP